MRTPPLPISNGTTDRFRYYPKTLNSPVQKQGSAFSCITTLPDALPFPSLLFSSLPYPALSFPCPCPVLPLSCPALPLSCPVTALPCPVPALPCPVPFSSLPCPALPCPTPPCPVLPGPPLRVTARTERFRGECTISTQTRLTRGRRASARTPATRPPWFASNHRSSLWSGKPSSPRKHRHLHRHQHLRLYLRLLLLPPI